MHHKWDVRPSPCSWNLAVAPCSAILDGLLAGIVEQIGDVFGPVIFEIQSLRLLDMVPVTTNQWLLTNINQHEPTSTNINQH